MTLIRGRAPLRLGLAGGGTDVEPYSSTHGGRILNVTIDRYAYATVEEIEYGVEFLSPDRTMAGFAGLDELDYLVDDFGLHVAVFRRMMTEFNDGEMIPVRLATQVDAPPGSGLGSSSTLVVAMVAAMAEFLKVSMSQYELARLAWEIERIDVGLGGGWQDQYAAAFGGFNYMEAQRGTGHVIVNPLRVRRSIGAELEASLLLYFGGISRSSADVIAEQQRHVVAKDQRALAATDAIRVEAQMMKDFLLVGDIRGMANSLRDGWEAKKRLASRISTPAIERAYEVASQHGMIAGKVSGAGGGGFMMLFVDPVRRLEVERSLVAECGGVVSTCHFTEHGAEAWRTVNPVVAR
ncbi:MAG: GHMP kinase [Nocardioides sp.]|uniref:GHMP family kinase ATP-binding protein n=1 Tax=Nocardioides sp. TaxID=35761 RepID=UPI0039E29BB9